MAIEPLEMCLARIQVLSAWTAVKHDPNLNLLHALVSVCSHRTMSSCPCNYS